MTFPVGWTRRAAINIAQVDDALADFPVHLTAAHFLEALDASSAFKAATDGADVRFSADAAGSVGLPCHVRQWVQDAVEANRKASVIVKVPALMASAQTTIYVWYGAAGEAMPGAADPIGSRAAYDSGFVGVYPLDNPAIITNATGGAAGVAEGGIAATVDGPAGLAIDLDGVNDAISFGAANTANSTWELIVRPDSLSDQIIVGQSGGATPTYKAGIWLSANKPTAFVETSGSLPYDLTIADSVPASTATWEHLALRSRTTDSISKALPAVPQTHQARCSDGTHIYSIGGHSGNPAAPVTSNQRYDPAGNSWTTLAALPAARWGAACVHLGGKIYVMGGAENVSTVSSRNDIYDIAGNSWSAGAALPSALTASVVQGHRACTDGTYIYVFAGPAMQRYDPVGNTWTALTTMPVNPGTWQSLICSSGSIYVIGGSLASAAVYRYDIGGGAWDGDAWDAAPYGAWAHVCEPVGDGSWLLGFGRRPGGSEQSAMLYRYNPETKVWSVLPPYDIAGNAFASGVIAGVLYVYGAWFVGRREDMSFGHHASFNVSGGAWETLPAVVDFVRSGIGIGGMLSSAPLYPGTAKLYVGRQDAYGSLFSSAKVAEFRVSSVARSRAWLKATKDTLLSAETFAVAAAPQDVGAPVVKNVVLHCIDRVGGEDAANIYGISWAFFDETTPDSLSTPTASGTGASTDASGNISVSVVGTALGVGEVGYLVLSDTDGSLSDCRAFAGPVQISGS